MATDLELQLYSARAVNFATNATSPTKSPRSPAKSLLTSHNGAPRGGIQPMPKPPPPRPVARAGDVQGHEVWQVRARKTSSPALTSSDPAQEMTRSSHMTPVGVPMRLLGHRDA
jgi:hypothetical protein